MRLAVRSFGQGLWMTVRAPGLIAAVIVITMIAAVPFGLVLGRQLRVALSSQPPIATDAVEIDPGWWAEFRAHAEGIAGTFTPAVIGVVAPISNLSAVLDGQMPPLALALPVLTAVLVWAFLWGGIIARFDRGQPIGARQFIAAGRRHFAAIVMVSAVTALVVAALYLTVHAALFGPVYESLAARAATERGAFAIRVALYLIFGGLLAAVGLIADYSRIRIVTSGGRSAAAAVAAGARFVAGHPREVVTLYVLAVAAIASVLTLWVVAEAIGGSRLTGWRGIAIGQAYIVVRLAMRLTLCASQIRLFGAASASRNI